MTLFEPIGKAAHIATDAGFVARDDEDAIARSLLRPPLTGEREAAIIAGFDAYARLTVIERAEGDATGRCVIAPRCWQALLGHRVATVVMAHNHPSGIARPSDADLRCTREAAQFLRLVGIELVDHLIFVESGHFSFRRARLL